MKSGRLDVYKRQGYPGSLDLALAFVLYPDRIFDHVVYHYI